MDTNSTSASSVPLNAFPLPPAGLNYIAAMRPSIIFLMIGAIWTGILLPIMVALFLFSSKDTRRKPIFIFNVLSLVLGIFLGIFNTCSEIHAILSPLQPWSSVGVLAFSIVTSFTPWLVEMILVIRLLAVYPFSATPKRVWFAIFIPLFLMKTARFVNLTIYAVEYVALLASPESSEDPLIMGQILWNAHPGTKIEWVSQVLDNSACSILFIARLQTGLKAPERIQSTRSSYTSTLKGLFWIAVSNFVFPVILSIVQLVLVFRDPDFLKGSYIYLTNSYVEIIGVLLATVWTSSTHWSGSTTTVRGTPIESNPQFAPQNDLSTLTFGAPGSGFGMTMKTSVERSMSDQVEVGQIEVYPQFAAVDKSPGLPS